MAEVEAFHRKFRPTRLTEYIGNDKMKMSIMKALEAESKPQVLLLIGNAGCGKTSMARLIAKEMLCENRSPRTGACNHCDMCHYVDEYITTGNGDSIANIKEYDIGTANSVEDINIMLEEASQPVFGGGWSVYILDEVHNLSKAAQTRLLKTLEEPPENVMFILCTTNPEKILDTILSRCQYKFRVKKPARMEMCALLSSVCARENIEYEDKGLSLISSKADFVIRQSLILLEQVYKEKGDCKYESVVDALSVISDEYYFEFYNLLLRREDIYRYIAFISKVKSTMELSQFIDGLIPFSLRGIYICNGVVDIDVDKSEIKEYKKIFDKFSGAEISDLLTKLLKMRGNKDIEANLILLGYTGLNKGVNTTEATVNMDNIAGEQAESRKNFLEKREISEEKKAEIIEQNTKELSLEDISEMFGGVTIMK